VIKDKISLWATAFSLKLIPAGVSVALNQAAVYYEESEVVGTSQLLDNVIQLFDIYKILISPVIEQRRVGRLHQLI